MPHSARRIGRARRQGRTQANTRSRSGGERLLLSSTVQSNPQAIRDARMVTVRQLSKAPIVEAIVEMQVDASPDAGPVLKDPDFNPIVTDFPKRTKLLTGEFQLKSASQPPRHRSASLSRSAAVSRLRTTSK